MLESRKQVIASLLGVTLAAFALTFFCALFFVPAWKRLNGISAFDIAVLVAVGAVWLQAIVGLFINNFMFFEHAENKEDFWLDQPFEFFYIDKDKRLEDWRLARGRFLFYLVSVPVAFGLMSLYFEARA